MTIDEILHEVERLSLAEKWEFFKRVVTLLEAEIRPESTPSKRMDYHEFLRQTYGSLQDTPLQRYDQGEYEENHNQTPGRRG